MTVFDEDDEFIVNINILPDELILHIFKCLPMDSILSCENVCERWRILVQDPLLWRHITVVYSGKPGQSEISEKNLEVITSHNNYISCLKIQYVYSYSVIKSMIEKCCNLINLELVMCRIDKEFEIDILMWPRLKKINLKNSISLVSNPDLNVNIQFNHFKELNYLALSDFGLSPINCNSLLKCSNLTHIFIEKIKSLQLTFIKELIVTKQNKLITLHIYGGDSVNDDCLKLLAKCPVLKDLAIVRCELLSDEGLIALETFKSIEHLQIWNNIKFTEGILLRTLSSPIMMTLKSLSLSRIQNVTPVIVDVLSEYYKNLKVLDLYQCPRIINTDYEKQLKSKFRNIDVVLY